MAEQTAYDSTSFEGKKPNVLRERFKAGLPTVGTRIFSSAPIVTEVVGNTGKYDYVEFLAEYSPVDQYDFENIARAAELHHMASLIKVDYANRVHVAQKAIGSGFQAVLFADHREAKDVEETILSMRADCPQDGGHFGFTPRRLIGYSAGFTQMQFAEMLRDIVCCFMIEKKEAVDNIEEICAVKGLDMIQFGPADFSMSWGTNAKDNGENIRAAEEKCIKTALKYGVRPRAEIMSPEQAKRYIDLGVKDFNIGGELWNLAAIWGAHGTELQEIISDMIH
jgi:2-keto-3-deoxy-L-rhamnonate aldolase RhmA